MELKWRIVLKEGEPNGRARFLMECPYGHTHGGTLANGSVKECSVALWQRPAQHPMWHWDGNMESPSITPSINCLGQCGRHFTLTSGKPT